METQYLEAGAGPPLLLLHGHEQSATSWRWVIPALARTHRVLALSLPGPAGDGHAPGANLAPFVAAFLVAVGAGARLDLVGHSADGAIALRLTLADPARIRTLTLVDSTGLGHEVHPLLALDTLPVIGELADGPHGDVGAHPVGEFDGEVAESAEADDRGLPAGAGAPAAQRGVGGDARIAVGPPRRARCPRVWGRTKSWSTTMWVE